MRLSRPKMCRCSRPTYPRSRPHPFLSSIHTANTMSNTSSNNWRPSGLTLRIRMPIGSRLDSPLLQSTMSRGRTCSIGFRHYPQSTTPKHATASTSNSASPSRTRCPSPPSCGSPKTQGLRFKPSRPSTSCPRPSPTACVSGPTAGRRTSTQPAKLQSGFFERLTK